MKANVIADLDGVAALGATLDAAPWVALSIEDTAMRAYRVRTCLLVVATPAQVSVIDTCALAGKPYPLAALTPALTDPARPLWVHGGEYLVAQLKREYDVHVAHVVDSQQGAMLLGWPQTGYRALCASLVGQTLPAPASFDWTARPLTEDMLRHAVDDVRHLPDIIVQIHHALSTHALLDEFAIACEEVAWTPASIGAFDPTGFYRLRGARTLSDHGLRVLHAAWVWREKTARDLDVPPGKLLTNDALLQWARHPEPMEGLRRARFHSLLLHQDRAALIDAIIAATDASSESSVTALPARRVVAAPTEIERQRRRALKRWRQAEAERRGVGVQGVLPAKALRFLARHGAASLSTAPSLGACRVARYGEVLEQLCENPGS
jgi:ribonuclease D